MKLPRPLLLWGPVVLWAALIFALSAVPSLGTGLGGWDTVLRKCAHVTEYAILALLLYRALGRELPVADFVPLHRGSMVGSAHIPASGKGTRCKSGTVPPL